MQQVAMGGVQLNGVQAQRVGTAGGGHKVLADAGNVVIAGDMWHLADSQRLRTVPANNFSKEETLRSMDKVEALVADNKARLVRQHVPEDIAALPAFPAGLE